MAIDVAVPGSQHKKIEKPSHFGRKTVFADQRDKNGSYRFELLLFSYSVFSNKAVPENADNVKNVQMHSRMVTYITRNKPTKIMPTGKGLELTGHHPNDLYKTESTTLGLILNGKSVAAGTEIHITRGGTRHRNNRDSISTKTNKNGEFTVTWLMGATIC